MEEYSFNQLKRMVEKLHTDLNENETAVEEVFKGLDKMLEPFKDRPGHMQPANFTSVFVRVKEIEEKSGEEQKEALKNLLDELRNRLTYNQWDEREWWWQLEKRYIPRFTKACLAELKALEFSRGAAEAAMRIINYAFQEAIKAKNRSTLVIDSKWKTMLNEMSFEEEEKENMVWNVDEFLSDGFFRKIPCLDLMQDFRSEDFKELLRKHFVKTAREYLPTE